MTSRSATNPTALRYVTEIQPCQEVAIPKVSTRSATPNARLDTAGAARPISQRMSSDIGGLSTGAPAYNAGTKRSPGCSPCKRNMPPGATPCRTVSATPQPLRPYRPSSNLISMNSPPSCRRAVTVAINMLDDHTRKMRSDNCRWQQPTMTLRGSCPTAQAGANRCS